MAAPPKVDYERIEPGWRAGILSPAQLAEEYTKATGVAVTRVAIIKHFEKLGVPRDLKAKIQAKADAMVAQAMVTGMVSTRTTATTAKIIDGQATTQAQIRLSHQAGAKRLQALVAKLTAELEKQTRKQVILKERASTAKTLVDAFGRLVAIEREAHGINADEAPDDDPVGNLLKTIKARTIQPVADDPDLDP